MSNPRTPSLAEKRRILQLETLHDLGVALHASRPEHELVDELIQKVCTILDPAAAVAVTRDTYGEPRALAGVGWLDGPPPAERFLEDPLWRELQASGQSLSMAVGELAGRRFENLLATPLSYRGSYLGYMAFLDKEERGGSTAGFTAEDRRFLESVAVLAAVALDSARQVEELEVERERLEEENRALRGELVRNVGGGRIVAKAESMRQALALAERVAPRGVSVVVRGESGTGKELVAKLVHTESGRNGPLVAVNCAAIPETLLESELFGIERGVATGVEARRGKFELAAGGTLFLDEIGDLSAGVQVKLLRALQEREIVRVGSHQVIPVDVRLIAATHRNLDALVAEGSFREDLYYRIKGVEILLPPLRKRRQDIPHLVRHFTERFCAREGINPPGLHSEALAMLLEHDYPGNVRELQNLVEAALSLAEGEIGPELMRSLLGRATSESGPQALDLETVERRHIGKVLQLTSGNKSRAARLLGIDRRTLQRKGF